MGTAKEERAGQGTEEVGHWVAAIRRKTSEEGRREGKRKAVSNAANFTSSGSRRDWASLPVDILELVLRRLPLSNAIRCSAACKQWRVSAAASGEHPWAWDGKSSVFYRFSDDQVYSFDLPHDVRRGSICCGSYGGWMIMCCFFSLREEPCLEYFLFNPFSATRIKLPDSELLIGPRKVVLSSPPENPHCLAVLFHALHGIGFYRPASKQSNWTMLPIEERFADVVFYNQSLYVATKMGELKLVQISSSPRACRSCSVLPPPQVQAAPRDKNSNYKLMECGGDLLMLMFTSYFAVFKANLRSYRWEPVDSLGSRAIFLSDCCCTTTRAANLLGVEEDHIYFIMNNQVHVYSVSYKRLEMITYCIGLCPLIPPVVCLSPNLWSNEGWESII